MHNHVSLLLVLRPRQHNSTLLVASRVALEGGTSETQAACEWWKAARGSAAGVRARVAAPRRECERSSRLQMSSHQRSSQLRTLAADSEITAPLSHTGITIHMFILILAFSTT